MFKNLIFILLPLSLWGQTIVLDSLKVDAENKMNRETFHKTQSIKDSVFSNAVGLGLTEVLREQTPIFFKESGAGMVSSVSFRGTTAQHTAVLWNGLNINSQLLGQTDFNAVSFSSIDELKIEYGAGGTESGSGAIGGTISLNTSEKFNQKDKKKIQVGIGGFQHYVLGYSQILSHQNSFVDVRLFREQSENNYDIPERNYENVNGEYWKNDLSLTMGYKWGHHHKILFYNEVYNDKRNFSLIVPTESKSKYYNFNQRHLLRYFYTEEKLSMIPEIAFLKEKYKYFPDKTKAESSRNGVNSLWSMLQVKYKISPQIQLETKGGYVHRENFPASNTMQKVKRNEVLWSARGVYNPHQAIHIEVGGRKEWISNYNSPFLYSLVFNLHPIKKLKFNLKTASTFRVPSFNDLYWQPGGNEDLKAEHAKSYEISTHIESLPFQLTLNAFYQNIDNMIRWLPTDRGYWKAFNVDEVNIKGVEANVNYAFKIAKIKTNINGFIGYTHARDVKENETLIYVPPIKAGFNVGFGYKNMSVGWNNRFVDDVYFSVGREKDSKVEKYYLNNIYFKYKMLNDKLQFMFKINNLNNKIYQTILNRYQPQRNFNFKITYELF